MIFNPFTVPRCTNIPLAKVVMSQVGHLYSVNFIHKPELLMLSILKYLSGQTFYIIHAVSFKVWESHYINLHTLST